MPTLKAIFGADTTGFDASLKRMQRMTHSFVRGSSRSLASSFTSSVAGFVGTAALGALARRTMAYADQIEETSSRIGVGTSKLQEWSYAAKQTGASVEDLTRTVEQLSDAARDPKNLEKFARMGINPAGMTPESLFAAVNKFAHKSSSTEVRAALDGLVQVKGLGKMMNLLQSDLDALGQSARTFGAVLSDEMVHQAATLNDQFSILSQILYTQFAPALLTAASVLLKVQGMIAGTASEFGAKTAGMSLKEILLGPFLSKKEQQKIFDRVKNDPNQAIYDETGQNLFAAKINSIEDMLKLMENWKPPEQPKITVDDVPKDKQKKSREAAKREQNAIPITDWEKHGGFMAGGGGGVTVLDVNRSMDRKLGILIEQGRRKGGRGVNFGGSR